MGPTDSQHAATDRRGRLRRVPLLNGDVFRQTQWAAARSPRDAVSAGGPGHSPARRECPVDRPGGRRGTCRTSTPTGTGTMRRCRARDTGTCASSRSGTTPSIGRGCAVRRASSATGRQRTTTPRVVPARGDTEHAGHRGDAETRLIRTHEPVDLPGRVSRANQAVAFANISRSSRSRRFSRRSRRSSSRSSVRSPSLRTPASRSASATQVRIACDDGSNSRVRSSGVRPDRTRSTILLPELRRVRRSRLRHRGRSSLPRA